VRRHIPGIEKLIDADQIVKGEGIAWMRQYLGERSAGSDSASGDPVRLWHARAGNAGTRFDQGYGRDHHPLRGVSAGMQLLHHLVIFRRKGKSINFYESGDELYELMEHMEHSMHVDSFSHHG